MKLTIAISLLCAAAVPSACGASSTQRTTAPATTSQSCKGAQLSGRFAAVAGSAGAGNISYALTLKNVSKTICTISGLPAGLLLGKRGGKLPTHIRAEHQTELAAVLVRLRPGASARATARFSPDVPGVGEPVLGSRCEPVASSLRVTAPGGGTVNARISPATSVCEHGRMFFSAYSLNRRR
jgi:hypothetical protein